MAGCIVSVEAVEISITDTNTSASANLSASQTLANCIPLGSWYGVTSSGIAGDSDDWDVALTFASSPDRVVATRQGSVGQLNITVYVVEFDPTEVAVQQVSFSLTGATGSQSITSLTQTDAWVVCSWNNTDASPDFDNGNLAYKISADGTQIDFQRESDGGTIAGTAYVAEALNGAWVVDHVQNTGVSGNNLLDTDLSGAITLARSFIIGSQSDADVAPRGRNLWRFSFLDTDTIRAIRLEAETESGVLWMQAIELASGYGTVEEVDIHVEGDADTNTATITEVDLSFASVHSSSPGRSMGMAEGTGTSSVQCAFAELVLNDSTTLQIQHYNTSNASRDVDVFAYVVDWVEADAGGDVSVSIGSGTVAISGSAPTADESIPIGSAALSLAGFAVTADESIPIGAGTVTLVGSAITTDESVPVSPGTVSISGFAPEVFYGNAAVSPGAGTVSLAGFAPTVSVQAGAGGSASARRRRMAAVIRSRKKRR